MTAIEPCIYPLKATKTKPAGYRVQKFVMDQWGQERLLSQTFRGRNALQEARQYRDLIEHEKAVGTLHKRFPTQAKDQKVVRAKKALERGEITSLAQLFGPINDLIHEPEKTVQSLPQTLGSYVEAGMTRDGKGRLSVAQGSPQRGYLRRIVEDNSNSDAEQKLGIWSVILAWGGIAHKRLEDITGTDVDDFVRYLEVTPSKRGVSYGKESIRRYRMALMGMVKGFALELRVQNPLDVVPPRKKPSRVKGNGKKRKVTTDQELDALEQGLIARIKQAEKVRIMPDGRVKGTVHTQHLPRRVWAYHVFRVMKETGMRPSEVLYLETRHVDVMGLRIIVEGGAVDGEGGLTKTGKAKGDREEGTRIVPVPQSVIEAIQDWLRVREGLGFPKSSTIFSDEQGGYATDDSLRDHFRAAGDVCPYSLRHYRNDFLRRQGMPSEIRQKILGHIDEETNLNYTHVHEDEARKWF
jgi:integrase